MTEINEILPLLLAKTRQKKLEWDVLAASVPRYEAKIGVFRVVIERPIPTSEYYNLSLYNERGLHIEKAEFDIKTSNFNFAKELFGLAHRSAHRIDETMTRLVDELKRL